MYSADNSQLRVDTHEEDMRLDDTLHSFWELESLEISGSSHQDFEDNIAFQDGQYKVHLHGGSHAHSLR